jgi:FkbM family methyltransferase
MAVSGALGTPTGAGRPVSWLLRLPGLRRYGARLSHAQRQIDSLRARVQGLRRRVRDDRARHATRIQDHKSRQLTADVLRQALGPRHRALLASSARDAALLRDREFTQRSGSYAEAIRAGADPSAATRQVTIEGLSWRVPLDAASRGDLSDRIVRDQWLPYEDILAVRELAIGTAMIDVGANIGTTSIPRVVLGDFAYVYAAEPDPINYACLVDNVAANGLQGFVLPDRVAIGAADGDAVLRRKTQIGTHHLTAGAAQPTDIAVPVRTLDSWTTSLGVDLSAVTFIKVDTQGWESHVLRGASRLLARRHIAWQIEFSPRLLKQAGASSADLLDQVEAHFTHFIDLGARTTPRARPIAQIRDATAALDRRERRYTDLLLYNAGSN